MTEWTPTAELNGRRILMPDARTFADVLEYLAEWDHASMSATGGTVPSSRPDAQHLPASGTGAEILRSILDIGGFPVPGADETNEIGPFCTIRTAGPTRHGLAGSGRRSVAVRATPAALAAVADQLVTSDDRLSWEVIEHAGTGRALVILSHGQIIGSHYVAYIEASTIPAPASDAPPAKPRGPFGGTYPAGWAPAPVVRAMMDTGWTPDEDTDKD